MDGSLFSETFGARLSRLRHRQGIRQYELAQQIGTSADVISGWESDRNRPRAKWRPMLAKALGVTECYLRTGTEATLVTQSLPPITTGARWETQPAADVELFRRLWQQGVTTRKMARRLGINPVTVWQVRKRLGLSPRPSRWDTRRAS